MSFTGTASQIADAAKLAKAAAKAARAEAAKQKKEEKLITIEADGPLEKIKTKSGDAIEEQDKRRRK